MPSLQEFGVVSSVYGTFDQPLPKPVTLAQDVHAAAEIALTAVRAETEPAIDISAVRSVTKTIDAIASYRATAAYRLDVANEVEAAARSNVLTQWNGHETEFHERFKAWFNDTATAFLAVVDELDGEMDTQVNVTRGRGDTLARANKLAEVLTQIRRANAMMHGRLDSEFTAFWRWTQVITVDARMRCLNLAARMAGDRINPAPVEGSAAWWAKLAAQPGVTLAYHSKAEQTALYETLPSNPPANAA